MIPLIFPKVPQSYPESLGFPSYPLPLNTPFGKPCNFGRFLSGRYRVGIGIIVHYALSHSQPAGDLGGRTGNQKNESFKQLLP